MSLYAIGDLHLAKDPSIQKPMDVFGAAWENHESKLEEYWRTLVKEEDTVIVAGDISWALKMDEALADLAFLHSLPGTKVCIKGNHDLWWHGITKMNEMYQDIVFLQGMTYETPTCFICGSRGWVCPGSDDFSLQDEKIYKRELLRVRASLEAAKGQNTGKDIIGVLHYPPTNDKHQPSGFTQLFEEYGVREVVYGHLHGEEVFKNGLQGNLNGIIYRLVSLDKLDATPLRIR